MFPSKNALYFLTLLIFVFQLSFGQKKDDITTLEKIIQESRKYDEKLEDINRRFSTLPGTYSKEQQRVLNAIQKALLGEKQAELVDASNQESTSLFEQAVQLAEESNRPDAIAFTNMLFGFYYYTYAELIKALPIFIRVSEVLDSHAPKLIEPCEVYVKSAYYYGNIEDSQRAIKYLKTALSHAEPGTATVATIHYAIGIEQHKSGKTKEAEASLLMSKEIAPVSGDFVRYAKALGELAQIDVERGNLAGAEKKLLENIAISKDYNERRNLMYAQIQLAKLYLQQNNINGAKSLIDSAYAYAYSKNYLKGFEQETLELKLEIAQRTNNSSDELKFFRALHELAPQVSSSDGKEVVDQANWELQKNQVVSQLEVKQGKLERASIVKRSWTAISILLFIVLILGFVTYRRRLKMQAAQFQSKMLTFEMDKIKSEKKLDETHNSLTSFRIFLNERDEQINVLEKELLAVKTSTNLTSDKRQGTLTRLLESHLMTDENWNRFKAAFQNEEHEYYTLFINALPGLTESNIRIIILHKMGLTTTQAAHILGLTTDAVKKAKQRLKKKYGDTINQFLT